MDRPLWQILLPMLLVGLALQRGAAAVGMGLAGASPLLVAFYGLQTALALATALALWLGRAWTVPALIATGAALVLSAALEGFLIGVRPPLASLSEMLIVGLATGALAFVLRAELPRAPDGTRRLL